MLALFQKLLDWVRSLFWKEEMELTLVGLQYSGKTTFVNVIAVINLRIKYLFYFIIINYVNFINSLVNLLRI
jgi:hypothetical protein